MKLPWSDRPIVYIKFDRCTRYSLPNWQPLASTGPTGDVSHALRQAVNTVIQGTAADLIKLAIAQLHATLPVQVRRLLTVHDSVLLEVPEELVPAVREPAIAAMQTPAPGFTIPIKVDVATGSTWAACTNML